MAENAQPDRIRKEGRPAKVNSYNYKSFEQEGTSATYLTARIARDRPDILADMKAVIEIKFARQKSADITFFSLIFAHYSQHSVASC